MKPQQTPESSQGQRQPEQHEHGLQQRRNASAALLLRRYSMAMGDSPLLSFPSLASSLSQPQMPIGLVTMCEDDFAMQRQQQMQAVIDILDSVLDLLDEGSTTTLLLLDEEKKIDDHRSRNALE